MIKAWIITDEWYPVYTVETDPKDLYSFHRQVDIPEDLLARAKAAQLEFDEVQSILGDLGDETRNTTTQSD